MALTSSPLVVVANRLPFILEKDSSGSFVRKHCECRSATTVAPIVAETNGLWVGWPGIHKEDFTGEIPEAASAELSSSTLKSKQVLAVSLPEKQFDGYYNGCCKATFWPLFHSMPDRATFQADKWRVYKKVNEEFAMLTVEGIKKLKEKDPNVVPLIWLQDYHLMMAANKIREVCDDLGLKIRMAFFLHIPFPSWDIVRIFPWVDELLQGILGCDSVSFQVEDYCLNFIDCCQRHLGCRIDRQQMLVEHNNRTVAVHPLPISIPYERFVNLAKTVPQAVKSNPQQQLLLGIDILDYIKGLPHRIKAFEMLLQKHPEYIEKVTLLQVVVPSVTDVHEYQELKEDLDQLIGRIKGKFSTPNWSPIRYIYGDVSEEKLAAFYRDSSVTLVTPLRDGMNLVAKEFVACQTEDPGVLILSSFAGAGSTMPEAVIVNPYETEEFAEVIHRALTMPLDERKLRIKKLQRRVQENDLNFWFQSFLKTVHCLPAQEKHLEPLVEDYFDQLLSSWVTEQSRYAILLDYDGTLSPICPHPDLATMPDETRQVLQRLAQMPNVTIAIISGRSLENVKSMVGIEGITYAGSHGFEISHPNGATFQPPIPGEYKDQLDTLKERLKEVSTDGAWVEDKGIGITFHFRQVSQDKKSSIVTLAEKIFSDVGIKIHHSKEAFEARPPVHWDKGRASLHILSSLYGEDFDRVSIIYAGDDRTDEDALLALQGLAITFRITTSQNLRTTATYRLPSTDAVLTMLKWIENRLGSRLSK